MEEYLKEMKRDFESLLASKLDYYLRDCEEPIASACRYAVLSGGKRIRPILAYIGAEIMGKSHSEVDNIALAIECMHNYSLVHDDLPSMDNDTMRHGKKATHVEFGEGIGVLAGDALLNLSAEILLDKADIDDNYIRAMRIFMQNSGIHGMIAGQCIDLVSEGKKASLDKIIELNTLKTSCLFKASLVASCVACGGSVIEQKALEIFCEKLGLVFQLVDDILDVTANEQELGKNIGSDDKSDKSTYLSIVGMARAKEDIKVFEKQAIESLACFGTRASRLIELTKYLTYRAY